jgi:signal peptidase
MRWASSAALVLVLLGLGVFLRPTWLPGGDTSNLIVSGHSMDGTYRTGDLVVVKAKSSYRPGQIVGFQVPEGQAGAGMVVIHRLDGVAEDGHFFTKGDNNPERDPWTISTSDIRGTSVVRLPSVGAIGGYVRGPLGIAGVFGSLAAWVAFGLLDDKPAPKHALTRSSQRAERRRQRRAAT